VFVIADEYENEVRFIAKAQVGHSLKVFRGLFFALILERLGQGDRVGASIHRNGIFPVAPEPIPKGEHEREEGEEKKELWNFLRHPA
jgi:hypothetical protein